MSGQLLLRGGRVVDGALGIDGIFDVLIDGERVATVAPRIDAPAARVFDASGCIVTAGFVDLHAHLREPGYEQKGTIASETAAALRGGFTTVCAMPNTLPAPDSGAVVRALKEIIERDAVVRVLPIGCVTRRREGKELADLGELAEAGCVAFSDDGSPVADARLMRSALELAGAIGVPLSEHCDDPDISRGGVMNEGRVSERLGLSGQPIAAEVSAIARNIALVEATGARLHIAHVTTARGLELIAEAKAKGLPITCEVTPSHLFLTEEAVFGPGPEPRYDTNARINPPLRTEADRRALCAGLNSGLIDAIATDHAPHAIEDKLCEFDFAANGISCFETALGQLMTLVSRGELDLARVLRALTSGPAGAFDLSRRVPGIASLAEGSPSDITIIDPNRSWTVETARFVSKGKNSPLDGVALTGAVVATIVGGKLSAFLEPAGV